jgi:hypothetical protein
MWHLQRTGRASPTCSALDVPHHFDQLVGTIVMVVTVIGCHAMAVPADDVSLRDGGTAALLPVKVNRL